MTSPPSGIEGIVRKYPFLLGVGIVIAISSFLPLTILQDFKQSTVSVS